MDSSNLSFTISSQESLLHNDQVQPFPSKKPRIKNLKTIIFSALLILVIILIAGTMILSSSWKKEQNQPDTSLSFSARRYYCHLTPHDELCYSTMSSILNTTALQSNPDLIFTAALRVAVDELNNVSMSITKAVSSPAMSNPLVRPRLSMCQTLVDDSLSHLNKSLGLLGVDSAIESLTYMEMDIFTAWTRAAAKGVGKCFLALKEIGEDEKTGVEEVKLGVEKAKQHIVNSMWLFKSREFILSDFYSRWVEIDDYFNYNYYFEYKFLVCLYSAMYLFIVLLYFQFWRSN